MNSRYGSAALCSAVIALGLLVLAGCSAEVARRPTLAEARSGQQPQEGDIALAAGEVRAEVAAVDPARREIRVIWADNGRRDIVPYDITYTHVYYNGFDYPADALEAGDLIAFVPAPPNVPYVDRIRLQVPVQARAAGSTYARAPLPPPRPEVLEGTVERIDYDRGVFDLRPRTGARVVTVALPYNARGAEIDNFRRLRRGDYVRVEGEFVNSDNVQLMAFLR